MKTIGLFGGSFSPIHTGHIQTAKLALTTNLIDEVLFIPAYNPNHKSITTSFKHRKEMVKLAIKNQHNDRFKVSGIEEVIATQTHKTKINTIDLITYLQKATTNKYYFIIGGDSYLQLPTWVKYKKLLTKVPFIVVNRDYKNLTKKMMNDNAITNASITFVDGKEKVEISSTQIRETLSLIDENVLKHIAKHNLYPRSGK